MAGVIFQVWAALLINSRFLKERLSNKTVKLSSSVRKICAAEYGCQYNVVRFTHRVINKNNNHKTVLKC